MALPFVHVDHALDVRGRVRHRERNDAGKKFVHPRHVDAIDGLAHPEGADIHRAAESAFT